MAATGDFWTIILQWPWPMVSAGFAALAFSAVIHVNFIRPWRRRRLLHAPVKMYFISPPSEKYVLSYLQQDRRSHMLSELVVPAHSEVLIYMLFVPIIHFKHTEMILSIKHNHGLDYAPEPIAYRNLFIKRGRNAETTPETSDRDYIDHSGQYHVTGPRERVVGTHFTAGYVVKTAAPGTCTAIMAFVGEEVEGTASLPFFVDDRPSKPMRCVEHLDCWIKPATRGPISR